MIHHRKSKRISIREWLVATTSGLTLAFTAWGLGGVQLWSLHVLLLGGGLTLLLALMPWPSRHRMIARGKATSLGSGDAPFREQSPEWVTAIQRLLRWPFFWCSALYLIYLLLGAFNPAAEVVRDERGWWVEAIPPTLASWLPTSVRADYTVMNAWRVLVSFSGTCFLVWGIWAGVTRRKTSLLVLWCLLLSGVGMGMVGILQHLTEAKEVLWNFPSSNRQFWGSFFYRNQGAAYLNIILVAAAFLFFYHAVKTRQRSRSGGPHFLCFFLFFITATSIGLALSRGGILFGLLLSVVFAGLLVIYAIQSLFHVRSLALSLITIVMLATSIYTVLTYIDYEAIEQRFGDLEEAIEGADQDARAFSTKATWDMAQDRLTLGWGAGSFRHIFPMYQRNYPEIYYNYFHKKKQQWIGRKVYRYAHNDIVQFLAEYGVIGSLFIFGGIVLLLAQALYHSGDQSFATLVLLAGVAQAFGHAFLDFIFNSPAYWMAFMGLLVTATKLLKLEQKRPHAA
ncbi:O-antigen ligase family protein [Coraliomargarita sp. SDUM461004]|uniref:O-antigen ligase family protein n=1 Tax=Thalassobacterium sedimentorum TaxID=3041258 RepID=A0ABU1AK79_9BACT|nr:O-antigen ligase family protein [Coraliomargarita sp. SDUM461004]MDQ8195222.1 O-antigen ligase family protein [Coraliomargarita sp. SDUM461004]